MLAQLLVQVSIYCLFPLLLTFEKNPQARRVSLYIYVSLVLIMGGFLGAVYSVVLPGNIGLSGGTIAYGGFMMACIMMAASVMPRPAPPYSSGMQMPSQPSRAMAS